MDHEPISMASRLPDDALSSPSPSPSPSPPPQPPVASTSTAHPEPGPARTITLTSVSPVDPNKRRDFSYRYYAPSSSALDSATRSFLDLPESYFQPLPSEIQHAHASSVKRREDLVDRPLLTQKLRDQHQRDHDRDKARRWPHTRIRIRWPDRTLLEGVLPSTDKVVHLYEFVRIALRPDARDVPFVLYQTPPRTEYRRGAPHLKGKSLIDLDFTPSSAFYIKFEGPDTPLVDALNDHKRAPPLVDELLGALAELPAPPTFDPRDGEATDGEGKGKGKGTVGETDEERKKREKEDKLRRLLGGGGKGRGGVTPSWMKVGKDAHKK
ncbi:hypothetical protein JCM3775_007288 [Rhodotorula graminis]|uniref:UBX domain-containing protein n=1 Tax=Rhodotorula graminis (strain WP1) TaxID=578459 RepID=A0A0P9EIH4_RHOGW|nr:uncharacterized protein RHOBADRAFT_55357 [Rhodotorula graminis WP1]KPV73135.1 hypothetical protein RHOBADRAFT_55357 [Rhodotorula graminis WP1]